MMDSSTEPPVLLPPSEEKDLRKKETVREGLSCSHSGGQQGSQAHGVRKRGPFNAGTPLLTSAYSVTQKRELLPDERDHKHRRTLSLLF